MAYSQATVLAGGLVHVPIVIGLLSFFNGKTSKRYREEKAAKEKEIALKAAQEKAKAEKAAQEKQKKEADLKKKKEAEKKKLKAAERKAERERKKYEELKLKYGE